MQCHTQHEPSDKHFHFVYVNTAAGKGSIWDFFLLLIEIISLFSPGKTNKHFILLSKREREKKKKCSVK